MVEVAHDDGVASQIQQPCLRPDLLLRLAPLRHVLHRPNNPQRVAGRVPDDKSPVVDERVRAVLPAKAIFVRPELFTLINYRMDFFHHPSQILFVQPIRPGLDGGLDFLGTVAEERLKGGAPPDQVVGEIPVPNHVVGGPGDQLEACLTAAQRLFRAFSLRDVRGDAVGHPLAILLVNRRGANKDPNLPPVLSRVAAFGFKPLPPFKQVLPCSQHAGCVLWMNAIEAQAAAASAQFLQRVAINLLGISTEEQLFSCLVRRPHRVRDVVDEGAELGLVELQRFMRPALLGHVPGDYAITTQAAFRPAQRGDHHIGPELSPSVLDPPVLVLELAHLLGQAQVELGLAQLDIRRRIQPGHMLADHVRSQVTKQLFRTLIPSQHAGFRIQGDDGETLHLIHQSAKSVIALPQGLFRPFALDRCGQDVGHRLEKVRINRSGAICPRRIRAQHSKRPAAQFDQHDQSARHGMLPEQGGRLQPLLRMPVRHVHWMAFTESEGFLRGGGDCQLHMANTARLPPGTAAEQKGFPARLGLEHAAKLSVQGSGHPLGRAGKQFRQGHAT